MADFGTTENLITDPNFLNLKFETLNSRFDKLPLGVPDELFDSIRDNLGAWGDWFYSHPTVFQTEDNEVRIKSWCPEGQREPCNEATRWNQVYRQTLALMEEAERITAGEPAPPPPGPPVGPVVKVEEELIAAKVPLWWLLVPVTFLLGSALLLLPRRLRDEGRGATLPAPVDGVDDYEDCGCDGDMGDGDMGLRMPPSWHLDTAERDLDFLKSEIKALEGDIRYRRCEKGLSSIRGVQNALALSGAHIWSALGDPESTSEERKAAERQKKQVGKEFEKVEKLHSKYVEACIRG